MTWSSTSEEYAFHLAWSAIPPAYDPMCHGRAYSSSKHVMASSAAGFLKGASSHGPSKMVGIVT